MFRCLSREEKKVLDRIVREDRRKEWEEASAIAANQMFDNQMRVFKHFTDGHIRLKEEDQEAVIKAKNIIGRHRDQIVRRGI